MISHSRIGLRQPVCVGRAAGIAVRRRLRLVSMGGGLPASTRRQVAPSWTSGAPTRPAA